MERDGSNPGSRVDHRIVFDGRLIGRGREKNLGLTRQWMSVEYREISLARAGVESLEDELAASRNVGQREVLRGRSDKDQVVVLRIIQREKSSALHPKLAIEHEEDVIELMDRQNFSDARVVIENETALVGRSD